MHREIATHLPQPNPTAEPTRSLIEHLPMVRFLAQRIHQRLPQHIEFGDLFSAGLVGLMQASSKFDPAKKIKFTSFATFRVRGAILDSLRDSDWAPRELRQKGRLMQETIRALTARFGHTPSEDQVAAELKISLAAYQTLVKDLYGLEIGSLEQRHEDGSGDEELIQVPGPQEDDPLFSCLKGEMADRLSAAIADLPELEGRVTTLYYYEQMTMLEVGLALGINGVKASRICASAVLHLRSALSDFSPHASRISAPKRKPRVKKAEPLSALKAAA